MFQTLKPSQLTLRIPAQSLGFTDTSALISVGSKSAQQQAWIAQSEAKKAAEFGLNIQRTGFNLLALGEPGTGRTSLMLNAMYEAASKLPAANDLVALYQADAPNKPLFLKLPAGVGIKLKSAMDKFIREFVRQFVKELGAFLEAKAPSKPKQNSLFEKFSIEQFLESQIAEILMQHKFLAKDKTLQRYFTAVKQDILDYLEAWQHSPGQYNASAEADNNFEALLSESFLGRYRVNLLVAHKPDANPPVIYDNDPSLQSIFGGVESSGDANNAPEFLKLRAGNLLRADCGTLLLHLRDILADEQNGAQILEKLHRFLRNGTLQIEDLSSGSNQGASFVNAQAAIVAQVKLVIVATREDYYALLEETPDFFNYFPIKIEFAEKVKASTENYAAYAAFIAQKCQQFNCKHFEVTAVAGLLEAMHRHEEDQTRLSTQFAVLEKLILESAAAAELRGAELVSIEDVKAAIHRKYARHSYIEAYMRDSIVDNELMINVQGEAVGQINGLTHIDLADASFGSPVRISANCYPGSRGVLTIDREVALSGPTHDKGVMILQSWLHSNFAKINPLNMTASLVFEQEYSGVDGDSASCAELFALLSSLSKLPIRQGIAVTGALNQHGEVLPVGGLNEKIEGYFRVCKEIGLDSKQGVLIPERNMRHLMLSDEVIEAVEQGLFHISTMSSVADGIQHLTGHTLADLNQLAEKVLAEFKTTLETNLPRSMLAK